MMKQHEGVWVLYPDAANLTLVLVSISQRLNRYSRIEVQSLVILLLRHTFCNQFFIILALIPLQRLDDALMPAEGNLF